MKWLLKVKNVIRVNVCKPGALSALGLEAKLTKIVQWLRQLVAVQELLMGFTCDVHWCMKKFAKKTLPPNLHTLVWCQP